MKTNSCFRPTFILLLMTCALATQGQNEVKSYRKTIRGNIDELLAGKTDSTDVFQNKSLLTAYDDLAYQLGLTPLGSFLDFHTRMIRLNLQKHVIENILTDKYKEAISQSGPIDNKLLKKYYAVEENYVDQIDSLDRIYNTMVAGLYMQYKYTRTRFLPTANHPVLTKLYYNSSRQKKFEFLRSATLYLGDDLGAFQSELIAGYLGLARISVNSILGREKKAVVDPSRLDTLTSEELDKLIVETDSVNIANATFNKIISGGGEVFVQSQIPILNINGNRKNRFFMETELISKISFDVPVAGSEIAASNSNTFASFLLGNRMMMPVQQFSEGEDRIEGFEGFYFYASVNPTVFYGNKRFAENLGIKKNYLWALDASAGIMFKNYMVYANRQWFSDKKLNDATEWRIGISLIRNIQ